MQLVAASLIIGIIGSIADGPILMAMTTPRSPTCLAAEGNGARTSPRKGAH